jgi:hypothetical protein
VCPPPWGPPPAQQQRPLLTCSPIAMIPAAGVAGRAPLGVGNGSAARRAPARHVSRMAANPASDERRDERPRAGGLSTRRWRLTTATRVVGRGELRFPAGRRRRGRLAGRRPTSRDVRGDLWRAAMSARDIGERLGQFHGGGRLDREMQSAARDAGLPRHRHPSTRARSAPRGLPLASAAGRVRKESSRGSVVARRSTGVVVGRSRAPSRPAKEQCPGL